MIKAINLGIWMDHSVAHLMEYSKDEMETTSIHSKFTSEVRELAIHNGENRMHTKEKQLQAGFYKEISEVIANYKTVILFGPTDAKLELLNILKDDHHFSKINIEAQQTDKMTENQQHAFVRAYFSKQHFY